MGLYQELSRYYDEIFAVDFREMAFISALLQGAARILDVGCGTGNKTVHLAAGAAEVIAVDLDETMTAMAKASHARGNIRYQTADILHLAALFEPAQFNGIACLGNTLVHLPSAETIQGVLKTFRALLAPDGIVALQILNYDRIITRNIHTLPVIDAPNARFMRRYVWRNEKMRFITALEIKKTGQVLHNESILYPLRKRELETLLQDAGFRQPEFYGSYQGEAYSDTSFVLIAACRR